MEPKVVITDIETLMVFWQSEIDAYHMANKNASIVEGTHSVRDDLIFGVRVIIDVLNELDSNYKDGYRYQLMFRYLKSHGRSGFAADIYTLSEVPTDEEIVEMYNETAYDKATSTASST